MVVKRITKEELKPALTLAHEVYKVAVEKKMDENMNFFFWDYAREEKLAPLIENQELVMYGVYDREQLVGVGALQKSGNISMLYVHWNYVQKGVSKLLIQEMKRYCAEVLKLGVISANVFPIYNVQLFNHYGFRLKENVRPGVPYVAMGMTIDNRIMEIPRKPIKIGYWLLTLGVVVAGIIATIAGYLFFG